MKNAFTVDADEKTASMFVNQEYEKGSVHFDYEHSPLDKELYLYPTIRLMPIKLTSKALLRMKDLNKHLEQEITIKLKEGLGKKLK